MGRQAPVIIRRIRPEEYDAAGDLIVETYRTLGDVRDEFYEQQLRDVAGRVASGEVLVAEMAGRLVGSVTFVDGQAALSEVDDPDAGTIRMLGVSTNARGHGVGEALVAACVDQAVRSGRRRVRLDTRTSMTSAQRLYERLGFRRDADHDWSPAPGILLLGYVLDLDDKPEYNIVNHQPSGADRPTDDAASRLAADLAAAQRGRFTIASRRGTTEAVSLDAAYGLGRDLERERTSAGWRPVGWKLGFTNQALWSQLGLDRPIRARIYEQTLCTSELEIADLVQPRVEPEIVLGFGADVPRNSSTDTIAAAIEWVAAGLEVVRCHFAGWAMTPAEAVADAGVHAALAVGRPTQVDSEAVRGLATASCELFRDGMVVATGRGADVLGGPLDALRWLLRELPGGVRAGEIVTTGTLTPAMPIEPGQRWEHRISAVIALEPAAVSFR